MGPVRYHVRPLFTFLERMMYEIYTPCKESHTYLSPSTFFLQMIAKYRREETHEWIGYNVVRRAIRDIQQRGECQVLPEGDPDKVTFKLGLEGCVGVHQEEMRRTGL